MLECNDPRLIPAHAGKTTDSGEGAGAQGAHPRSRGENSWKLKGKAIVSGSSPLTRGKPTPLSAKDITCGLIPAHAGKTCDAWCGSSIPRAHPRSRGENDGVYFPSDDPVRLIPAHAGKTV